MTEFERIYGEYYGVIHRNGSVTVSLPLRASVKIDTRFAGPLWSAVVRFWVTMVALSAVAWWDASQPARHLGGGGSLGGGRQAHAWLIPAVTIAGGLLVIVIARASGLTMTDRRLAFSGWVVGLVFGATVALAGILGPADVLGVTLGGGLGLFLAFLITIVVLARRHEAIVGLD